jgi:uncharacterized phage-associated protein
MLSFASTNSSQNMEVDDILKLKAVTLYILKSCGETDFIHLFKILYFAERHHYATYGKHITTDTFCALERGPVPSFLYDAVKVATGLKRTTKDNPVRLISSALRSGGGECNYYVVRAIESPDMDELSRAEIASLDKSIKDNQFKNIQQLSHDSHDIAWQDAWERKHSSPINSLLIAKAGGANAEFIEYLKEEEQFDKLIKS